jgi:hypothetical protein
MQVHRSDHCAAAGGILPEGLRTWTCWAPVYQNAAKAGTSSAGVFHKVRQKAAVSLDDISESSLLKAFPI